MLLFCAISCANRQPLNNESIKGSVVFLSNTISADSFPTGSVVKNIMCKNDPSQSYALYIPLAGKHHSLPVIYFFDPHADGSLPLIKYKSIAEKLGFILVGSNNSKNENDYSMAENIWQHLFSDTKKRININTSRVYVCGFSGGAKVAGYLALNNAEIKSIIANSASLPDGMGASDYNFSFTGIAGDGDMNMTNVVSFCNDLDKTKTSHRIIIFKGKHEWAPKTSMATAFEGLMFDAMRSKQIETDNKFINNYIVESEKKINVFVSEKEFINAADECTLSINMLAGLTPKINFFKEKQNTISLNEVYKKKLKHVQDLFDEEEKTKTIYQQQFQNSDINYWKKTINELKEKGKLKTDEAAMNNRLLAYLSLAFYSITNRFIQSNQNDAAAYFVSLYKMADIENNEAWYLSAIINARKNDITSTENDLLTAIKKGFNDKKRMNEQPEFQSLHINLSELESKMK